MRHRRLLLLAATPALSVSVNTSWAIHPASKRLLIRPGSMTTTSQSILSAEASSLRTKDSSHVKQQLSRQLFFCQTNNIKFLSNIWRRPSGIRQKGITDQTKRNISMSNHDNTPPQPNPHQPLMQQQQDDSEQFNGVRTKFGRRERRTTDKLSNNARVRNSYLKLIMEDAVYDQLYNLVCQTSHQWQQENNANTIGQQKKISKKQSKRQLTINPRNRNSLHMTYFFAGKVLEDMTSEELQRWECFVRKCVLEHTNDGLSSEGSDYSLRFKSLETFPPNRQNLIVAVFESSIALDDLYEKLCGVAVMEKEKSQEYNGNDDAIASATLDDGRKDYEFPLLRNLTKKQQEFRKQHDSPCWIAHVTLGSLVGGSREDVRRLSEWLGNRNYTDDIAVDASDDTAAIPSSPLDVTSKTCSESKDVPPIKTEKASRLLESNIDVLGLGLGGPVPGHVDIDWNFPLKLQ